MEACICASDYDTVGHTIEPISKLKTFWMLLWVHTVHQPEVFSIRGPFSRLQYFYWIQNSVHLGLPKVSHTLHICPCC